MNLSKRTEHRVERQVFLNREDAMAWLEALLDNPEDGTSDKQP
jgi:hypothetical protein